MLRMIELFIDILIEPFRYLLEWRQMRQAENESMPMIEIDQFNKFFLIGMRDQHRSTEGVKIPHRRFKFYAQKVGYMYGLTHECGSGKKSGDFFQEWQESRARGVEM